MPIPAGVDFAASLDEDATNRLVRELMRQRPSTFNYATPTVARSVTNLCEDVPAPPEVRATEPLVTTMNQLPVLGAEGVGLEYCVQITSFAIDFHPSSDVTLPDGQALGDQQFALQLRICAGVECPDAEETDDVRTGLDDLRDHLDGLDVFGDVGPRPIDGGGGHPGRPGIDVAGRLGGAGRTAVSSRRATGIAPFASTRSPAAFRPNPPEVAYPYPGIDLRIPDRVLPFPFPFPPRRSVNLQCFCLSAFLVGSIDMVERSGRRVPRLEIGGLQLASDESELSFPEGMKNGIECYLEQVIQLGVLPALDDAIRETIQKVMGTDVVSLDFEADDVAVEFPEDASTVPHNPAVADDRLTIYVAVDWEEVTA